MLSVRNTANHIIQFTYGEDGIDPSRGSHGSPFNLDLIIDAALGDENRQEYNWESFNPEIEEEDMGAWEFSEDEGIE